MKNFLAVIGAVVLGILIYALIMLVFAFPAMWLWNAVMPALFGLPTVSYWMIYGFMLLIRIIFPDVSTNTNSTKKS